MHDSQDSQDSVEQNLEVTHTGSSKQVEVGGDGYEQLTKKNLEAAIGNIGHVDGLKQEGKLVAAENPKTGGYIFKRWIDLNKLDINSNHPAVKNLLPHDLILIELDPDEQKFCADLLAPEPQATIPIQELESVDVDDDAPIYGLSPTGLRLHSSADKYDRDKGTYV